MALKIVLPENVPFCQLLEGALFRTEDDCSTYYMKLSTNVHQMKEVEDMMDSPYTPDLDSLIVYNAINLENGDIESFLSKERVVAVNGELIIK